MANFTVLDENNTIVNLIIAQTKEIAELVTGKTCVFSSDSDIVGSTWIDPAVIAAQAAAEAAEALAEAEAAAAEE